MNDIILKIDHVSKAFGKKVVIAMKGKPKAIGFIYKNQKCNAPKSN